MKVHDEAIPPGSRAVYVFLDGDYGTSDPDLRFDLYRISAAVCWVAGATGKMPYRAQQALARKAAELGYQTLTFKRRKAHRMPRYARCVGSDALFNYFEVDLTDEAIKSAMQE